MKKVLFILFVLSILAGKEVNAQDTLNVKSQDLALIILDKIDHETSLTKKQKEEIYALLVDRSKQIDQIKNKNKSNNLSKESVIEVNENAYTKLKKVLTDEQFNRLQALREETLKQKEKYSTEELYLSDQDIELDF